MQISDIEPSYPKLDWAHHRLAVRYGETTCVRLVSGSFFRFDQLDPMLAACPKRRRCAPSCTLTI